VKRIACFIKKEGIMGDNESEPKIIQIEGSTGYIYTAQTTIEFHPDDPDTLDRTNVPTKDVFEGE
jgi:hypothetical protein